MSEQSVDTLPQSDSQNSPELITNREVTLTLGIFFDGTDDNADNVTTRLQTCSAQANGLTCDEEQSLLRCAPDQYGQNGSYGGFYTNIYWLNRLYHIDRPESDDLWQQAVYISGIGTTSGKSDSLFSAGTGEGKTGVVAKTDEAVTAISVALSGFISMFKHAPLLIKKIQFDIFGFSRGAAAARHFANRIQNSDDAVVNALRTGLNDISYQGNPAGETRFIGIFDTVVSIINIEDVFSTVFSLGNPSRADTGAVDLQLRPGVAQQVFHITAQHECRYNFALNSVAGAWPELCLPGVHSDIGGGYNPEETEHLFLTRPAFQTVLTTEPAFSTQLYQNTQAQIAQLKQILTLAAQIAASEEKALAVVSWNDDHTQPDDGGHLLQRVGAAVAFNRTLANSWSIVPLRVMIDAAGEAGVCFNPILPENTVLTLPAELEELCDKARTQGKILRAGGVPSPFGEDDMRIIGKYLHCSANWNPLKMQPIWHKSNESMTDNAVYTTTIAGFLNRPDKDWCRTVYNLLGVKE